MITDVDNNQISTGYNGIPRGVLDLRERLERPAKYLFTSHAEENAIAQAARVGAMTKGCTAYVTHCPCARCARMLIQAGIVRAVYDIKGTTSMPEEEFIAAKIMLIEAGIELVCVNAQ
ncbi:ComEB Deoxycytidylate deaminase [uncultured Caudovirales phage]|uniref:ComEB Deoxycytidylate deaminase n=1 Tax=uncultured Caudovirales phage TaxID=2100421 RepID=A0A6J5RHA6_9CAUD|nr:ComEB Deoxycytidylate deaminase [uncultured Caudovirales phage]